MASHVQDGIVLNNPRPVPRPGRWVSAFLVLVLVAMAIHGLFANENYQ